MNSIQVLRSIFTAEPYGCEKCSAWFKDPNNEDVKDLCEMCRDAMQDCAKCGAKATKEAAHYWKTYVDGTKRNICLAHVNEFFDELAENETDKPNVEKPE